MPTGIRVSGDPARLLPAHSLRGTPKYVYELRKSGLNNSIQDRSYIRQPLGYTLLAMAGLPHSRCNFVRV
ncbi:MAG TPA: CotH kinase family protein, partial [Mycobacterium sp.]|nr:CotH kinase family protein [Mycobacterium sp.]